MFSIIKIKRFLKIVAGGTIFGLCITGSIYGDWDSYWPFFVEETKYGEVEDSNISFFGPLVEQSWRCNGEFTAVRPIGLHTENYEHETSDDYFLYPFFSTHQTSTQRRWSIFNLIHGKSECCPDGTTKERLMIYPFIFSEKGCCRDEGYSGVFPLVGRVENFFGQDSIRWVLFPLYLELQRKEVCRYGLPWPFIRWQDGECAGGGAFWPLYGHFWKENVYDHRYLLWPLIYTNWDHLDKEVPSLKEGFLPFYAYERSAKKEALTILWPFFTHLERRDKYYVEDQFLWPLFVQGRGEEDYVNRWAPVYTHSIHRGVDKQWFFWPLLKVQRWEEQGMNITQEQLLYFLVWKQRQRSIYDPCFEAKKYHVWPLFSYWDNGCGNKQFQFLSPFEVFFPSNEPVRKTYSPLFAIIKCEQVAPGHARQSILFNLIKTEKSPCGQKMSIGPILDVETGENGRFEILKGLVGYKRVGDKKTFRLLWMSF